MKLKLSQYIFIGFVLAMVGLIFYATLVSTGELAKLGQRFQNSLVPRDRVEVLVAYAPELEPIMQYAIPLFNDSYARGINPVTNESLKIQDKLIVITGKNISSGTAMQGIVTAQQNIENKNSIKPAVFVPSVSHWLKLANFQSNTELFKLGEARATANAPLVMAIWESRLKAIQKKENKTEIGWDELLRVLNNPKGWNDYGFDGRKTVYYGHTNPLISSTALSTLIQEFTASARTALSNPGLKVVTLGEVNNAKVQAGVRAIESLIKHYSERTTEFKEYIAQGPNYVDMVALEENDLIYINQGKTQYQPPEKLIALYPKEGTFIHEHPAAIVNANWVSEDQKAGGVKFIDYLLSKEVQQKVLENGFRPASNEVASGYPITAELGVNPQQPSLLIESPEPKVINAIQQSWTFVKKRGEIYVLLDTSGSMSGSKMENAQKAIASFIEKLPVENNAGLYSFSEVVSQKVPSASLETNSGRLKQAVGELQANGTTALYDGLSATLTELTKNPTKSIRAVVMLSDGQDTASKLSLNDLINQITAIQNSDNPVLVIPIAYGSDADLNALGAIARASATRVISGDLDSIETVLQIVSSYF